MTTTQVCPWCSEPVQASAIVCPHCGRDPRRQPMQRRAVMQVVIGLFVALGLGLFLTGNLATIDSQRAFALVAALAIGGAAIASRQYR